MTDTEWLAAVHTSSHRLAGLVTDLTDDELAAPSFAQGWSIGQVLSHLGSAAEIGTVLVQRGIDGDETGPREQDTKPVCQRWDALSAPRQRDAWLEADAQHRAALDAADPATVRVPYFAGVLSVPVYAGYRLSEQSVHAWDIAVALDPSATIPASEVKLLWQRLDRVATRFRDAETLARLQPGQVALELTDTHCTQCIDLGGELHLMPCEPAEPAATVRGTAEAVLRVVYGRNRAADGITATGAVTVADLRSLFPGY